MHSGYRFGFPYGVVGRELFACGYLLLVAVGVGDMVIAGVVLPLAVLVEDVGAGVDVVEMHGVDGGDDAVEVEGVGGG